MDCSQNIAKQFSTFRFFFHLSIYPRHLKYKLGWKELQFLFLLWPALWWRWGRTEKTLKIVLIFEIFRKLKKKKERKRKRRKKNRLLVDSVALNSYMSSFSEFWRLKSISKFIVYLRLNFPWTISVHKDYSLYVLMWQWIPILSSLWHVKQSFITQTQMFYLWYCGSDKNVTEKKNQN